MPGPGRSHSLVSLVLLAGLPVLLTACGDYASNDKAIQVQAGGADGSPDAGADFGPETGPDVAPETSPDAGLKQGPIVTWTAPASGASISGLLSESAANCRVTVSGQVAVERVEFYVDGAPLNIEHSAPWSCAWDTSTAAPGSLHALTARAYDAKGATGEASIEVTVAGDTGVTGGKRSFYVDSTRATNGDGSMANPWNNLASVDAYTFSPGDWIYLYGEFGETIHENNAGGAEEQERIVYVGTGPFEHNGVLRARIHGIELGSSSHVTYRNLEASDPHGGPYDDHCAGDCCVPPVKVPVSALLIRNTSDPSTHHIRFENLYLHGGDSGADLHGAKVHDITFVDTEITDMWRDGIVLHDTMGDAFSYLGGSITNTGRRRETNPSCPHWHTHGIYASGGHNHVFDGTRYEDNQDGASLSLRRGDMIVRNNLFVGAPGAAMIGMHNEDETNGNRWVRVYRNIFAGSQNSSFYQGSNNDSGINDTNTAWAIFNNTFLNTKVNFSYETVKYNAFYFKNNVLKNSRLDLVAPVSSHPREVAYNSWYNSSNASAFADAHPATSVDPGCAAPGYDTAPDDFIDKGTKSIAPDTTISATEWGGYAGSSPDVGRTER